MTIPKSSASNRRTRVAVLQNSCTRSLPQRRIHAPHAEDQPPQHRILVGWIPQQLRDFLYPLKAGCSNLRRCQQR
jgi:hypothetical protein